MKCFKKKSAIISVVISVLFVGVFFEGWFLPEWFVHYSNAVNIILIASLLLVMKYFHSKKRLTIFMAIFTLFTAVFIAYINCAPSYFIEKIISKTPETKINFYIQSISKGDKKAALSIWELDDLDSNFKLKKRREKITDNLLEAKINSNFTIIHTEWWRTCCMPGVIDSPRAAGGARIRVQLIDSDDNKFVYVFDVFRREMDYWGMAKGCSIRRWVIRDIYPENEEPLFWTRESEGL